MATVRLQKAPLRERLEQLVQQWRGDLTGGPDYEWADGYNVCRRQHIEQLKRELAEQKDANNG